MRLLKRKLTLTQEHRQIVSMLADTELDWIITIMRSKFRPAKVYINGKDASHSFDVWGDFNLELGQEIVIEVIR